MRYHVLAAIGLSMASNAPAFAESKAVHRVIDPATIDWKAGPTTLPGGKMAVLYGDPTKPELFVMRLWLPANFRIAPHTHPKPELLTVISGSMMLGMGTAADKAKAHKVGVGAFSSMAPDTPHFGFTDEEAVIQISTVGPWSITYVNPADDPRTKAAPAPKPGE